MFSKYLLTVYYLIAVIYFGITCKFQWHQIIKTKKLPIWYSYFGSARTILCGYAYGNGIFLQNFVRKKFSFFRRSVICFERHYLHILTKQKLKSNVLKWLQTTGPFFNWKGQLFDSDISALNFRPHLPTPKD